jgi:hypothetical protein
MSCLSTKSIAMSERQSRLTTTSKDSGTASAASGVGAVSVGTGASPSVGAGVGVDLGARADGDVGLGVGVFVDARDVGDVGTSSRGGAGAACMCMKATLASFLGGSGTSLGAALGPILYTVYCMYMLYVCDYMLYVVCC